MRCLDSVHGSEVTRAKQASGQEEASRRPALLQTSLPLTGHSLASRSALNSPNTAPKTQHRPANPPSKLPNMQLVHNVLVMFISKYKKYIYIGKTQENFDACFCASYLLLTRQDRVLPSWQLEAL